MYLAIILPANFYVFAIFLAALLKVFPVLAIPAFVRSYRSLTVMVVISATVIAMLWSEISTIRSGVPISAWVSYGSSSIIAYAQWFNLSFPETALSVLLLLSSLIIVLMPKLKERLVTVDVTNREKQMFLVDGCLYVGTFILSSNWDYRLIFLIFCVPYVMKINDRFLRLSLAVLLLCALNQILLNIMFGPFGTGVNILSKILLFIVFSSITIIQLRNNVVAILNHNR